MATIKIYKLHFTAPLHISDQHDDLGNSQKIIQSDTLYAALMSCLAKNGEDLPEDGELGFTVSSLFPYFQKDRESAPVYFCRFRCNLDKQTLQMSPRLRR